MDELKDINEILAQIKNADRDELFDLMEGFEQRYLHYKLLVELVTAKKDGMHDYFQYLIETYTEQPEILLNPDTESLAYILDTEDSENSTPPAVNGLV